MNKRLSLIFLILCLGNIFGLAQSSGEKPKPTGLTLEITFYKGKPPLYMTIAESQATARWSWCGSFEVLPNFKTSAERPPVQAVKFIPYLENESVKIKVRVFTGKKSFENEEDVAVYTLRENERASVKELTNFGVAPFEIAVLRVAPSVSALPAIENKTTSLQVTGLEPNFSTLPSYKLTVLNASNKTISAFTVETMVDGRVKLSAMPQNLHNEPLIEAGKTYVRDWSSPLEYKQPVDGQIPKPASKPVIVISSVIFDDGTYEGDAFRASQFRAMSLGRKLQVKQLIALIESNENNFADYSFANFSGQITKLETKIDEQEFAALLKQFPSLTEKEKLTLRDIVEGVLDDVKDDFMNGTKKYRQTLESNDARHFLKGLKEQYQKWLARLA